MNKSNEDEKIPTDAPDSPENEIMKSLAEESLHGSPNKTNSTTKTFSLIEFFENPAYKFSYKLGFNLT